MIRVAHRTRPIEGEVANGDAVFVRLELEERRAVVAVVDGLGHGPNAAKAADEALRHLGEERAGRPAAELLRTMHDSLRGTRGVAATVCVFAGLELTICGVGNVGVRSVGTPIPFVLSPGIVGSRVSRFREVRVRLAAGDRVALYSDGVSSGFSLEALGHLEAEAVCESLFAAHRKTTDDATLLVLDVLG